ncbi:TIGR02281 family clan AA aspartic protease [Thalassotalea sp. HSM 43]|uniref:retropepsin-like aspartic protease family protein n=1 Tax=Thalassotalea sp. HSM 43 TaxID=2552945 RepID=UPI0010816951|nr:TIGR02281 family clan AA aspartic protease [Thalassotalea sp. HSM 43]QBY04843.1 TIGR02281 family clan AA aspartic protease [Thalassotalea sp. HSM 43]
MSETDHSKKMGKTMMWIAWGLFFALMIWFFQGALDKQHNPNQRPQLNLTQDGKNEVTLKRNRYGHYLSPGNINGSEVLFLLDTGATNVSIPANVAQDLNLPVLGTHYVQTANGSVKVQRTEIEQLSIGNIILYNVAANINPGMDTAEILLGMSALKQLEFKQSGQYLTLTEQY